MEVAIEDRILELKSRNYIFVTSPKEAIINYHNESKSPTSF